MVLSQLWSIWGIWVNVQTSHKDWKNRFPAIFHIETDVQWKLAFSPQMPKSKLPIAKAQSIFPGQFFHLFPGGQWHPRAGKQQCLRVTVIALPTWICAKSILQDHSHGRHFYPITLPVWISADPKKPHPHHKQSARDGLSAASTKEGSHGNQQKDPLATSACWACSEVAPPCDGRQKGCPGQPQTWKPLG